MSIQFTQADYMPSPAPARCDKCRKFGHFVAYAIRTQADGGRMWFASDSTGICEQCYLSLPPGAP